MLRKHRNSLSIGTKTLLSHLTLAVAVMLLASGLSYALSSQYLREARMEELESKARRIVDNAHTLVNGEFQPNPRMVRAIEGLADARVFFLDADSERIRMSRSPEDASAEVLQWVEVPDAIDREFVGRVLDGETVSALQQFGFAPGVILVAGAPIRDEAGSIRGGLILAQPVETLRILSRGIRIMLIIVMAISMLLAVVLAMQQTAMLVRPLQRITRAARQMEAGTYAERISGLPENEIGDLGRALNCMSGRLMDTIRNLRKERDKLELVVSSIGEGLVAVDVRWKIVHVNEAFLELMELENAEELLSPGSDAALDPLKAALGRCMTGGQLQRVEWENHSNRALSATASALKDDAGEILGTVCLVRDVSEAQRMEQLRRDYVANVSHELRTPLTGIRGMVEPLIDGCMDTEEERQNCYRVILKETVRLEKLVGEMLDLSRLQDGRVTLELEPMELPGILEAAARNMRPIAEEAGVTLAVRTDGSALACMGNEDRIMQVLVILIDNALSFTPQGGRVTVFARDEGDHVAAGVRDTGCGIEPRDLPMIWERFYKADRSRMRTTGTGLGLPIAKRITQLMGGEISAWSEPGKGSEFTFTLKKQ